MKTPTPKEMQDILNKTMAEQYPDDFCELGENWELIAAIFFELGRDTANTP